MVEWARGASERTFEQSAANSRKEPGAVRLRDARMSAVIKPASELAQK